VYGVLIVELFIIVLLCQYVFCNEGLLKFLTYDQA